MWGDVKLSRAIKEFYKDKQKDCLFISRKEAYKSGSDSLDYDMGVDFWFSRAYYKLEGNLTVFWALQLVKKFFPDKIIFLFGFDFYVPDPASNILKFYDKHTTLDSDNRNHTKYITQIIPKFERWMKDWLTNHPGINKGIINCNPKSKLTLFSMGDYKSYF